MGLGNLREPAPDRDGSDEPRRDSESWTLMPLDAWARDHEMPIRLGVFLLVFALLALYAIHRAG